MNTTIQIIKDYCQEVGLTFPNVSKIEKTNKRIYKWDSQYNFAFQKPLKLELILEDILDQEAILEAKNKINNYLQAVNMKNLEDINKNVPRKCPISCLELYNFAKKLYQRILENPKIPIPGYIEGDNKNRCFYFTWSQEMAIYFEFDDNNIHTNFGANGYENLLDHFCSDSAQYYNLYEEYKEYSKLKFNEKLKLFEEFSQYGSYLEPIFEINQEDFLISWLEKEFDYYFNAIQDLSNKIAK